MNFERLCIGCMREKKENEKICPYCGCDEESYVVPKQALQPFTILNGKYLLGRVLGIGGFGIAYIAVDIPLERRVAIKEFFPAGSAYREEETTVTLGGISEAQEKMVEVTREKFAAEARMLAQLEAMDGIVKVHDFFEENRTAYIVMEYLDGITLKDYVKKKARLSWEETLTKIRPVLHSLEILHENGILHRDISPDNIMVLKDESLKLFDFGGAKDQATQQGVSVVAFKKAGYSPIEQYQVDGELGAWSDEYALAATMYYCICGHAPAEASSRMLDSANFKTPHQEGVELPKEAEKVLLKGMAIKAADRYPSLKEFEAALYHSKGLDHAHIKKAVAIGIGVLIVAGAGAYAGQLMSGNKTVSTVENKTENKTEATEKKAGNAGDLKDVTEKQTEIEKQKTIAVLLNEGYQSWQEERYEEAVASFQEAADRENAEAQYWLGVCYETGIGIAQDKEKAEEYFKKAVEGLKTEAEQENAKAQEMLGRIYAAGEGVEQNTDEAIKWWKEAAYQGNPAAQYNLASCYLRGEGVEKNSTKAAEWFEKAAMQGNSYSQYELGKMYIDGNGIKKDEKKGKEWLQKAADQGEDEAQELLDDLTASLKEKENYKHKITVVNGGGTGIYTQGKEVTIKAKNRSQEGYEFVEWKITDGNVEIKDSFAAETTIVVPDQEATIEAVYQERKEETETENQKTIEELVSEGKQSFENGEYKEAVANFQIAADAGNAEAQFMLAWCYAAGNGVAQNDEQSAKWEEKAAEQGHKIAQYNIATDYLCGQGVEKNGEKAVEWFERAAKQGDSASLYMLGKMYIEGWEIEKDEKKGREWLQKAVAMGNTNAQELLDSLPDSEETEAQETTYQEGTFNGHRYMLFDNDKTYHEAEAYCESLGGHLATIGSQEENDYLYSYMVSQGCASAYFGFSDEETEGEWKWITGEAVSYTNWAEGEPNGGRVTENYAQFYWEYPNGQWNDGSFGLLDVPDSGGSAYLCEWES